MKERLVRTFGFLKTTAIGGLIFLLPLAVIAGLLGYAGNIVMTIYWGMEPMKKHMPVDSATGTAILLLIAVGILVALCFVCGFLAKRAIARKFSELVEKYLVMAFPKYAIYKDIIAGNVGGDAAAPSLTPITIRFDDMIRIGYEAGRTERGMVIVYLPGSPDPWTGYVALVESERVQPLEIEFGETSGICERLGRASAEILAPVCLDRTSCTNPAETEQDKRSNPPHSSHHAPP